MSACEVAIVGAGPVGQTLALLLGQQGHRVQLLEARAAPYRLPRAVHLDHQAARVLQAVRIMNDLSPWTEVMDAYEWRSASGATLLRLEAAETGASGWPESTMFHQPDLERLLAERIGQCTQVEVHRGCEVTEVQNNEEGSVAIQTRNGLRTTAAWLVGCDGAASTTRRLLNVSVVDFGYSHDWLVLDVVPENLVPWHPLNLQLCDPLRPTTAVSGGRGRRRWEFMRLPGETVEDLAHPDMAWRLLAPWGVTSANATLERAALYRFEARIAERWRTGNVMLAGDAAHQMPPFAGQGLCSGLRDAANVAWKLDAVLRGMAPSELLDTYPDERAPQVTAEIELSVELGKIICVSDLGAAAARDGVMAAGARQSGPIPLPPPPPLGPGFTLAGDQYAGTVGVQGNVRAAGQSPARFDDVMSSAGRWVLLGWREDPTAGLQPRLVRWLAEVRSVVCAVGPGASLVDADGTYGAWFAALQASAVLIRPDFVIFAAASDVRGINSIVEAARVALRTGRTEQ